jgi:short-subunit dehydrogenase
MVAPKNRRILLTGASSGIGAALAARLAADGVVLALTGRDPAALEAAAGACRAAGASAVSVHACDLIATESIEDLVKSIVASWGAAPDIMIHCAGVGVVGTIEEVPIGVVEDCISLHLIAAIALARSVLPGMRARGSGTLVFLSSGTAWYGVPGEAAYSAAKAGLERVAEALAIELAGSGITVAVVSPGPVETRLMRSPLLFGGRRPIARPDSAASPARIAGVIVGQLAAGKSGRIELSLRPRIVRHIAYWMPRLLARLLARPFHSAGS